jgi:cytochrome c-type biogenesis protein CcmH/NrfF
MAHQYGWDEALLFVLPIVVVLVGVRWIERRNREQTSDTMDSAPADGGAEPGPSPPPETESGP